ncbi:hypothetical protein Tco_0098768 [Tanacetum coccineum]
MKCEGHDECASLAREEVEMRLESDEENEYRWDTTLNPGKPWDIDSVDSKPPNKEEYGMTLSYQTKWRMHWCEAIMVQWEGMTFKDWLRASHGKKYVSRDKPPSIQALVAMKLLQKSSSSTEVSKSIPYLLDPFGHLPKIMDYLVAHVQNLGSTMSAKFEESLDSFLPRLIADALEERLPELLTDTPKNQFPQLLTESIRENL